MSWRCCLAGPPHGQLERPARGRPARANFRQARSVSFPSLIFMPYPEALSSQASKKATRRSPVACIRPAYSPCNTTYAEIKNEEADFFSANLRRRPSVLSVGTFNPIGCSCQLYDSQRYIIPTALPVFFWL